MGCIITFTMQNKLEILSQFQTLKQENKHAFSVLIDPDDTNKKHIQILAEKCELAQVEFVFMGGSIMLSQQVEEVIAAFKEVSNIPIVLFPGSPSQIANNADALLYLSVISGRNPELLIGQHVVSAPQVKSSNLEIIPTGYMIIDGGKATTVSYMSHSFPIPKDKKDLALCTAWAGEMQGKQVIYMDSGSGAEYPISKEMINKVSSNIAIPLIVGGGIKTPEKVKENCEAGAQIIVVGDAIEKDISLIKELKDACL